MPQETSDSSDLLTVDERFFLHIALKNGLLDQAGADRAMEACRQNDLSLEEAIRALGLLAETEVLKVREAMAASQVVRLDSVYGDVAVTRGLVPRDAVDAAFAEQRRQRYRVRLGNLLVERGLLSAEQHRSVITEVIRRLKELGPEAYGSTVERRGLQAERVAFGAGSDLAGGSSRLGGGAPASLADTRMLPPARPIQPSEGTARGWLDAGGGLSSEPSQAPDKLVESAIRIGLSSESNVLTLHRSDEAASLRDLVSLSRSTDPADESESASFVLDRAALEGQSDAGSGVDGFAADDYVSRRRRRQRLLLVGGGAAAAAVLAAVVSVGLAVVSNRDALADVRTLMAEAQSARDPEAKRRAYLRASERMSAVGSLGVSADTRAELLDRVRWGALQAEALASMAAGRPEEARQLLERRRAEVPALAKADHDQLLRQAAREHALSLARAAESRKEWAAAVAAYRDARDQGDPGGVAGTRLAAIRADLVRSMDALHQRARETLAEEDEGAFTRAAKLITELFNEDPGIKERLEDVQYRRAMARGEEALRKDELDPAQQAFDTARRLRPASKDVDPWLARVAARRELKDEERRGAEAERRGRWDEAVEFYRRALDLASKDEERRRFEETIERCRVQGTQDRERQRRGGLIKDAVDHLRASRPREAVAVLEELARAPQPEPAVQKMLAFARRVEGMVYVPGGPFRMGTPPGDGARPTEVPQRVVDVPAFFIGRTEVTNEQFAVFVETGAVPPPAHWTHPVRQPDGSVRTSYDPILADHPVVNVTWKQARAYAEWRGGRLPTEAQWEKAARGDDGRTFPWGEGTDKRVHIQVSADRLRGHPTAPVGGFADDTSPYGAQDMAGNVGEWTDDPFLGYPGAPPGQDWPPGRRTIRGGAYRWRFEDARCAARDRGDEDGYVSNTVGLRVVIEVPPEAKSLR